MTKLCIVLAALLLIPLAACTNGNVSTPEISKEQEEVRITVQPTPEVKRAEYFAVTADGVNIRRDAGTSYPRAGTAERDTLYALIGKCGNWFRTVYKGVDAYICADYCTPVDMDICADERVERVIEEGCRHIGARYVYGAVRCHDGTGKLIKGFTAEEFDCSSLMQYVFYAGAGYNLQVNTRTQVYQGRTVERADIARGDLLFFTNASRKDNKGVERIGHVALYLGDNYILHTASDYAKIERVSAARWANFVQAQRIFC